MTAISWRPFTADYMETTYWSGRMEHGKHDIEMDDTHTQ